MKSFILVGLLSSALPEIPPDKDFVPVIMREPGGTMLLEAAVIPKHPDALKPYVCFRAAKQRELICFYIDMATMEVTIIAAVRLDLET